jgi:hypothetical protein
MVVAILVVQSLWLKETAETPLGQQLDFCMYLITHVSHVLLPSFNLLSDLFT